MKGLYIHIPFCIQKCKYCDFTSFSGKEKYFDEYLNMLFEEMKGYKGEKIDSVFIGGGTPTVLSAKQLSRLIDGCFDIFEIADDYEFSVEANPGTLNENKMKTLLENGVNRISVGVQSFNNDELSSIGRIHDAKTAYDTIVNLHSVGFENINIDIMTALPFQTEEKLMYTLKTAMSLPIKHISAYSLILEDGTPLKKEYNERKIIIPNDEEDRNMYAMTSSFLENNGFHRYEISNFAKDGYQCRHNIKYWECNEYIGIGAAAHSYDGTRRYFNTNSLSEYICGKNKVGEDVLTENDKMAEFVFMGMRMDRGISEKEFEKRFGKKIRNVYAEQLDKFINGRFIIYNNGAYRFTDRGRDVSNSVLCEFV